MRTPLRLLRGRSGRARTLFFASLLGFAASPMWAETAAVVRFTGTVKRGETFRHRLSDGLVFGLDPTKEVDPCQGWFVWVGPSERVKSFASIATTPHYHGLIETDICGSDFRNSDNSGPNGSGPKNVNRPQRRRSFSFVMNQSDYEAWVKADAAFTIKQLSLEQLGSQVRKYAHRGLIVITGLLLGDLHIGARPTIARIDFNVELDLRNTP